MWKKGPGKKRKTGRRGRRQFFLFLRTVFIFSLLGIQANSFDAKESVAPPAPPTLA
jgi:hypothetical protein